MSAAQNITGGLDRRKTSKFWYGRFQVDGKRKVKNLFVEVRGHHPAKTKSMGAFSMSDPEPKPKPPLNPYWPKSMGARPTKSWRKRFMKSVQDGG